MPQALGPPNPPRPADDPYAAQRRNANPVFAVRGTRRAIAPS